MGVGQQGVLDQLAAVVVMPDGGGQTDAALQSTGQDSSGAKSSKACTTASVSSFAPEIFVSDPGLQPLWRPAWTGLWQVIRPGGQCDAKSVGGSGVHRALRRLDVYAHLL